MLSVRICVLTAPEGYWSLNSPHCVRASGRSGSRVPFAGAVSPLQTRHSRDSLKSDGKSAAKYWILDSRGRFPISQIEKGYGLRRNPLIFWLLDLGSNQGPTD